MKASDFKPWDRVLYIPNHANGEANHEDCENGVVHHIEGDIVFVRYIKNDYINTTSHSTRPDYLIHW
jgi:hypothetical protein